MTKIVTIGGGEIELQESVAIDKEIIRLSGKKKPKLLFIPTASSDSEKYWRKIQKYFGDQLGCDVSVLWLIKEKPSKSKMESDILSADIVYVGGGNTLKMMRIWRNRGVDKVLKRALSAGIILCGTSAGSICWYESGHSDSLAYYHPEQWKYIRVRGLGFIDGIHCPHFDSRTQQVPRRKNFANMITQRGGFGIAIDDGCAILYTEDGYRVIASKPNKGAYKVYKQKGEIVIEPIEKRTAMTPLSELYKIKK